MRLEIDKFGPISQSCFDLKNINLFIGESGVGKSIVTKLIYISNAFFEHLSAKELQQEAGVEQLTNSLKKTYIDLFFNIFKRNQTDFSFKYFFDDKKYLQCTCVNNELTVVFSSEFNEAIETLYTKRKEEFKVLGDSFASDGVSPLLLSLIIRRSLSDAFTQNHYIYIPAGRSFFSLMSENIFSILEGGAQLDQILTRFGTLFVKNKQNHEKPEAVFSEINSKFLENQYKKLLKGEYRFVDKQDRFYLKDGHYLSLNQISSGQQELLPALLILLDVITAERPTAIIFEEPEAHLFPKDQKNLIEFIVFALNHGGKDNKLFVTTHSPYVLSVINNLIYAGKLKSERIAKELHLDYERVAAYALAGGNAKSILNDDNQLIDANYIDEVSNEIAQTFDALLDEEYEG